MKGVCTNERSYYFGSEVRDDFEPEECGGKRCGSCQYFVPNRDYESELNAERYRELDRLRRLWGL